MKTIKITISQNIIDAANKLVDSDGNTCVCHCPVSLALNQQTDYHGWFVSHDNAKAKTHYNNQCDLPKVAQNFLKKWLQDTNSVEPVSFVVRIDGNAL